MSEPILFNGFTEPLENWSKLPHSLIDALPLIKSLSELKVVLYILRHTWGYKEFDSFKAITTDEFAHGRKKKDGTRIDQGVGMSEPSIRSAIKLAVKHGFIHVEIDKTDLARVEKSYQLNIQGSEGVKSLPPEGKKFTTGGKEVYPRSEKDTSEKKQKKEITRKRLPFPIKFPSNIKSYTEKHIEAYQKQHTTDMVALLKAWHGEMFSSLTELSKVDARAYIEVHHEMVRLNKPIEDYPALAKYTRSQEAWKLSKGGKVLVSDMLKHITDYKPTPKKIIYDDPSMDLNVPMPNILSKFEQDALERKARENG